MKKSSKNSKTFEKRADGKISSLDLVGLLTGKKMSYKEHKAWKHVMEKELEKEQNNVHG